MHFLVRQCYAAFRLDRLCRDDVMCNGTDAACPSPPPKPEGSICINNGQCSEVANEEERCVPLCEQFGASACSCTGLLKCSACCVNDNSLDPYCPFGYTYDTRTHVNGTTDSRCFENVCGVAGKGRGPSVLPSLHRAADAAHVCLPVDALT